jgi:hypothetical protein
MNSNCALRKPQSTHEIVGFTAKWHVCGAEAAASRRADFSGGWKSTFPKNNPAVTKFD